MLVSVCILLGAQITLAGPDGPPNRISPAPGLTVVLSRVGASPQLVLGG